MSRAATDLYATPPVFEVKQLDQCGYAGVSDMGGASAPSQAAKPAEPARNPLAGLKAK